MASNTNKVYKIKNKKTGKYIALGYSSKHTWLKFPSEVIKCNRHVIHNIDDYEIEQFELIKTKTFSLDGQEIK